MLHPNANQLSTIVVFHPVFMVYVFTALSLPISNRRIISTKQRQLKPHPTNKRTKLETAAIGVGDRQLAESFRQASNLIKRDVAFAPSLYLPDDAS